MREEEENLVCAQKIFEKHGSTSWPVKRPIRTLNILMCVVNLQKDLIPGNSETKCIIGHKAQQNKRQCLYLPIPKDTVWEMLNQTETSGVINEQTRSKVEAERVQKDKGFLHLQ